MPLSGSIKASLNFSQTASPGLASATSTTGIAPSITLQAGTGVNQADVIWSATRTVTAAPETLDLTGVLIDAYGSVVNLARVKGLYVRNSHATATLTIGGAASNAFATFLGDPSDVIKVAPGGFVLLAAPLATAYPVTAGTGDLLKIDPGSATITYDVALLGCSA